MKNDNNFKSRKFLLVVGAALLFVLNDYFGWGLTDATIQNVIVVIASFIGVEGIADIISRWKKK